VVLPVALAACFLGAAVAQPAAAPQRGEIRTVVVGVLTTKGQLVNGLDASYFRAKLGREPVQVLSATYDTAPRRVVLLLDVSGSMEDSLGIEKRLADFLLAQINPASKIELSSFATRVVDVLPFGTNRAVVRGAVEKLEPPEMIKGTKSTRKTALLDALVEGLKVLGAVQPGDVLCIISDGGDNASKLRESEAGRILFSSGVRAFIILPYSSKEFRGRTPEEASGPAFLDKLSERTGGVIVEVDREAMRMADANWSGKYHAQARRLRESLLAPLGAMARELNGFYRLEVRLPKEIKKPYRWKLEVVDPTTGKPDHSLILHYPQRLYPAVPVGAGN
jgi:hypothetical protein